MSCARAAGSALVSSTVELPAREASAPGDEESAAAVWVPARNLVLLAVAAAHAEAIGAQVLLAGFNREEAETFPDNSASFIRAMDGVLALGVRGGLEVVAPTQALEKKQVVAEARRLGFSRSDFWSCYRRGPQPCGCCESCVRSTLAWEGEGQD